MAMSLHNSYTNTYCILFRFHGMQSFVCIISNIKNVFENTMTK